MEGLNYKANDAGRMLISS